MIEEPRIVTQDSFRAAMVPIRAPAEHIRDEMPKAIREIVEAMQAQGTMPIGPMFAFHAHPPGEVFDFELGFPVAGDMASTGRVLGGEYPALKVVQTVYSGPYEGLPDAWLAFVETLEARDFLARAGVERDGRVLERYLAGPERSDDPADWRTELNFPLLGA
ncbi:GyrI-like domain-containing protein [Anianabacter salinae]|uniref:GyrI-like domain-containing protein n=1 Tax=Anianabacter salinae TaxID=2851023 RepID=UPI00225E033C|nr:GyrI-like domain-containing protein [Anianabacter salinae]MBV0913356.1 GyrI-like domain-containing protein [Anianabacter salinae]